MEALSQHEFQKLLGIPEWQFDEGYRKAWYLPVVEDGFMRFPAWQLNADPERLHVVLQKFKWYCGDVRVMHAFLETPHDHLGGRCGREAILDGGVDIAVIAQHAECYACEARARKKAAGDEVGM